MDLFYRVFYHHIGEYRKFDWWASPKWRGEAAELRHATMLEF